MYCCDVAACERIRQDIHLDVKFSQIGEVTRRSMPMLANDIMTKGALFVIAHPMSPGDPSCTGCRWDDADMMPGNAQNIEIWNGGP